METHYPKARAPCVRSHVETWTVHDLVNSVLKADEAFRALDNGAAKTITTLRLESTGIQTLWYNGYALVASPGIDDRKQLGMWVGLVKGATR